MRLQRRCRSAGIASRGATDGLQRVSYTRRTRHGRGSGSRRYTRRRDASCRRRRNRNASRSSARGRGTRGEHALEHVIGHDNVQSWCLRSMHLQVHGALDNAAACHGGACSLEVANALSAK
jgi:hypothetical protein